MAQYQSIFKRVEKKYLLNEKQYAALLAVIKERMEPDRFAESKICNLYYDTPDGRLIRRSLEKPVYKEKLRLRSYGTPKPGDPVFLELKKKFKGVVYKRRVELTLEEAEAYLTQGLHPKRFSGEEQILREMDWFLQFYGQIGAAMYLSYERSAWRGKEDTELRITFDVDICYRKDHLSLSSGTEGRFLLSPGQRLMEIKIPGAMPLWLTHVLSELEIYHTSFSKYGKAYLEELSRGELKEQEATVTVRDGERHEDREEVVPQKGGKICA